MKKSFSWQILLIIFAICLILLAFFPSLSLIFTYIRLSLLIALALLWLGTEYKNAILFCLGIAFSAYYVQAITPYWYFHFNMAPLFLGLLVLGIALHSLIRKRNLEKSILNMPNNTTVTSNDSDFLTVDASFKEAQEFSTSQHLQAVTAKVFCGSSRIDLTQAKFEKEITYITLTISAGSCHIILPKSVTLINALKSTVSEVNLPIQNGTTNQQVYLTGSALASTVIVLYGE